MIYCGLLFTSETPGLLAVKHILVISTRIDKLHCNQRQGLRLINGYTHKSKNVSYDLCLVEVATFAELICLFLTEQSTLLLTPLPKRNLMACWNQTPHKCTWHRQEWRVSVRRDHRLTSTHMEHIHSFYVKIYNWMMRWYFFCLVRCW